MSPSSAESDESAIPKYLMEPNILALLGAYPKIDNKVYEIFAKKNQAHYGIINDPDYCTKVDNYNLAHPENMLEQRNFFTDYPYGSKMIGLDL